MSQIARVVELLKNVSEWLLLPFLRFFHEDKVDTYYDLAFVMARDSSRRRPTAEFVMVMASEEEDEALLLMAV